MTTENHHPITDEDIRLYLCDALSPDRRAEIRRWFGTEEGQRYLSEIIDEDVARILSGEELHSSESIEIQPLHIEIPTEKSKKRFQPTIGWWLRSIAIWIPAILLLATGGYMYYNQTQSPRLAEIYVPKGDIQTIIFQDGTKVILNADSRLKYTPGFKLFSREVELEGEAYFEVTRNRHKPFTVQSDAIRVRVLGTTFNLKSNKRCRIAEATLIEGEIEVKGNKEEGQIILTPGQRAELNKNNGRLTVKQVDAKLDAVWHDNLIPFQKADIFTITKALERFYDVKIILSPDIQTGKTYSGVLKRKSNIESVLKSLQNSIPIDYKIVGNNIFISPK